MLQTHTIFEHVKQTDAAALCRGQVKVYKNKRLMVDTSNHIVISGRHWLMQRMFGLPYSASDAQQDWLPRWFTVGSGGASMDSPFQPIWPTDNDINVFEPIVLNSNPADPSKYTADGSKKLIDSITYDSALTAKVTMSLTYEDCDVHSYINEAGLFIAPTQTPEETNFVMFSHVTFPTIPKSNLVELLIEWFFIF